ncbi:hypothetical protein CHS0354_010697 [Potamilus streckersoni]|uniref:Cadherin domain-containing protein n=1 Tax=Potamilus streckersoni TaxID=2493646 RepID=A0AAE0TDA6_9BIVA|nr:hypothetical protein CHS0354_010697 [Potamilus streckersoni]
MYLYSLLAVKNTCNLAVFRQTGQDWIQHKKKTVEDSRMTNTIKMIRFPVILVLFIVIKVYQSAESTAPVISFSILEGLPIGYLIGSVKEKATLLNITQINLRFEYFFFSSPEYQSIIHINTETGDITTMVVIDRESLCEFSLTCVLKFDVGINYHDGRFYKYITVKIHIEDRNDNSPLFPKQSMTLQISERVQIGSVYRIDSPVDRDTGVNNSIQSIEIVPSNDVFGLDIEPNLDGSKQVKIAILSKLDREMQDYYRLIVLAKDGGNPVRSGSLTVNIYILDVNDNKPKFSNTTYRVAINETTPPNSVILILSATDADIGENGWVTYRISDHQSDTEIIKKIFYIDARSGEVQIKTKLMNEQGNSYKFIVEAIDHGMVPLVSQAEVIVDIIDSENNAPVVSLVPSLGGNLQFINVSESATLGTFVANLEIIDTDSGQNGNISCVSSSSLFSVDYLGSTKTLKRFIVMVNGLLDRETQDLHNVTIICFDHGSPRLSSSVKFVVSVTDVNDNKPNFNSDRYIAFIPENNDINEVILQFSATDLDIDNNGLVQYYIHEDIQGLLTIGLNNGNIYAVRIFDREANERVVFRILAIDLGSPALTGTTTVTLYIEDRNDQVPRFLNTVNPFRVAENLPSDTSVGYLKAVDGDTGINAEISFAMLKEYSYVPFVVFSDGLIKTNKELDREQQSRYDFQVMVTDHGEPRLSSIANVTVFVTDDNDNVPVITYPSEKNNTISIPYPDEENTLVCQIQAYDNDDGDNSVLVYSISAGNDLGIFRIDENLGHIYLKNIVSIDSDVKVSLTILTSDKGKVPLSSTTTLEIELRYTNVSKAMSSNNISKYVIISMVIVLVIVLLFGAATGIFFLRRLDLSKKKTLQEHSKLDSKFGFQTQSSATKPISTKDRYLNVLGSQGDRQDEQNKKKVMNFRPGSCFDPLANGHTCITLSDGSTLHAGSDTDGQLCFMGPPSSARDIEKQQQDRVNNHLEKIQRQRMMLQLQTRTKKWLKEQALHSKEFPGHIEDSHSHTSGETIPSDSGRGGSEDMCSFPASTDGHVCNGNQSSHLTKPSSPRLQYTVEDRHFPKSCQHKDNLYPPGYTDISVYKFCTTRPFIDLTNHNLWTNPYFTTHSPMDCTGDSVVNSLFPNTSTLQPQNEDNCSTMTSGSYSLYSEYFV